MAVGAVQTQPDLGKTMSSPPREQTTVQGERWGTRVFHGAIYGELARVYSAGQHVYAQVSGTVRAPGRSRTCDLSLMNRALHADSCEIALGHEWMLGPAQTLVL